MTLIIKIILLIIALYPILIFVYICGVIICLLCCQFAPIILVLAILLFKSLLYILKKLWNSLLYILLASPKYISLLLVIVVFIYLLVYGLELINILTIGGDINEYLLTLKYPLIIFIFTLGITEILRFTIYQIQREIEDRKPPSTKESDSADSEHNKDINVLRKLLVSLGGLFRTFGIILMILLLEFFGKWVIHTLEGNDGGNVAQVIPVTYLTFVGVYTAVYIISLTALIISLSFYPDTPRREFNPVKPND